MPTGSVQPKYDPMKHLALLATRIVETELPEGVLGGTDFDTGEVFLDSRQLERERRSTAAHEAVHLERGPFPAFATLAEERTVSRLAARNLITFDALMEALPGCESLEELAVALDVDYGTVADRLATLTKQEWRAVYARFDDPQVAPVMRRRSGTPLRRTPLQRSRERLPVRS